MATPNTELACKFTAQIQREQNRYVVEIPVSEIEYGTLSDGDICHVSIQTAATSGRGDDRTAGPTHDPDTPVTAGERRTVEIEDVGDKGDGIARVDRGYVLIVPETEPGDEVTVEIQQTNSNYGFATVVESEHPPEA